jgi:hypothetical protein
VLHNKAVGPIHIDGRVVDGLTPPEFTAFVNKLLLAEAAAQHLAPHQVRVTERTNDPDGGVDALLLGAQGSAWIPEGDSVWQFKKGEIDNEEARAEVAKPEVAPRLAAGAAYYLCIGKDVTAVVADNREVAIVDAAGVSRDRVKVYNASHLAQWAASLPSVLTYGPLRLPVEYTPFDFWRDRERRTEWTPSRQQEELVDDLRGRLRVGERLVRFEGERGTGKTRLMLEALDEPDLAPKVIYLRTPELFTPYLANHLQAAEARGVIVVDECDRRSHMLVDAQVVADGRLQIITVGESGSLGPVASFFRLERMSDDEIDRILAASNPGVDQAARRVLTTTAGGNVRWALLLAQTYESKSPDNRVAMLSATGVAEMLRVTVPEGAPFLAAQAMALLRRVGVRAEVEEEARAVAELVGIAPEAFDLAVLELENRGLVERQGRFRALTPFPLAVALAAEVWRTRGAEIANDLLPRLSPSAREALLGRAADLGQMPEAQSALAQLVASDGPFGSLAALEAPGRSGILPYLSAIDPHRSLALLERLADRPLGELFTATDARRDLVWSAEKLAWHSGTFSRAATVLLRLALGENENWANNATGQFVSLFGTRLPNTAAAPANRTAFLDELFTAVSGHDPVADAGTSHRLIQALEGADRSRAAILAIQACESAIDWSEMRTVGAEEQYGQVVEPIGAPRTTEEDLAYRRHCLQLLVAAVSVIEDLPAPAPLPDGVRNQFAQNDPEPRLVAARAIVSHAPGWLGTPLESDLLAAVSAAAAVDRDQVRTFIRDAQGLFSERLSDDGKRRLETLAAAIAIHDPLEQLADLSSRNPWEDRDFDITDAMVPLLEQLKETGRWPDLLAALHGGALNDNWPLGTALARQAEVPVPPGPNAAATSTSDTTQTARADVLALLRTLGDAAPAVGPAPSWLASFIDTLFTAWPASGDQILDELSRTDLTPRQVAQLAQYAPVTPISVERVLHAAQAGVSPSQIWHPAVGRRWLPAVPLTDSLTLLQTLRTLQPDGADIWAFADMLDTLGTRWQDDATALASAAQMSSEQAQLTELELAAVGDLPVLKRLNGAHIWQRVVRRTLPQHASEVIDALVHQILSGDMIHEADPAASILAEATSADPAHAIRRVVAATNAEHGWRVSLTLRRWWLPSVPLAIIQTYIGEADEPETAARVHRIAQLAPAGDAAPTPHAAWLLTTYPDDDKVSDALASDFVSGTWWGLESDRLRQQISRLEDWNGSPPVRAFARRLAEALEDRLAHVIEREQEES